MLQHLSLFRPLPRSTLSSACRRGLGSRGPACRAQPRREMATAAGHPLRVTYFDVPLRGQPIRLALAIAKERDPTLEWADDRVNSADWGTLKPSLRWATVPELVAEDGHSYGQSGAILRYVGKKAGLYPSHDDLGAMRVDEYMAAIDDMWTDTGRAMIMTKDKEARAALTAELVSHHGRLTWWLRKFEGELEVGAAPSRPGEDVGPFLAPDPAAPSVADLALYVYLDALAGGFVDGVPAGLLDGYPRLHTLVTAAKAIPAVRNYEEAVAKAKADKAA